MRRYIRMTKIYVILKFLTIKYKIFRKEVRKWKTTFLLKL